MSSRHDVVIAGAGPVGLFLACELKVGGVGSVLVLEQAADPHSLLKQLPFGMRGLWSQSLEAFERRGLLDDLIAASSSLSRNAGEGRGEGAPSAPPPTRRLAGHFAGIPFDLDLVDTSKWPHHRPGPAGNHLASSIAAVESVLLAQAERLGVEIRRGCGVDGVEATDKGVFVRAGDETFEAAWLVGCDGARSAVRKLGGFGFAGTEPEFTGYSVQVTLADPGQLKPGRVYTPTGMYSQMQPGALAMVDFDGGAFHRTQPITLEHVQATLRRISGTDVTVIELKQATTWTDRAFQATSYRRGRVLLAGDAAHIQSPLGGQGLNLGFGDAANLGWKLASTIRGDAPEGLLDSYERERMPVAAQVLDWSRAQVALMRPEPASRALEKIIRDLIGTRDGATYFAEKVWGVAAESR